MIDTIIFDIGNVLAMADWKKVFSRLDISSEAFETVADATVRSKYWKLYDKGTVSLEDTIAKCKSVYPMYSQEIQRLFDNLGTIVEVCDYSSKWIESYKNKGFKTYILSNFSEAAFEACKERFDFLNYVDGQIISYRVKEVKPDKAIYDCLVNTYGVVPENSVFIDDLPENIYAAREYGYHGVIFTSKEAADREIDILCQNQQTRN